MLWSSACSLKRTGKLRSTSSGLGRITGEIQRSSGAPPRVATHQSSTTNATLPTPIRRRVMRGGERRSASSGRFAASAIYFAGAASAG